MPVEIPDVGRLAGECGYQGGDWHKQPMQLGYSDTVRQEVTATVAAGQNSLYSTAVPVGEVHVIEYVAVKDYHTDLSQVELGVDVSGTSYWIASLDPPGANKESYLQGPITLKAGERIRAVFSSCALNDAIFLIINGRKIAVA